MEVQKTFSSRSTTKPKGNSKTAFYRTKTGKCQRPSGILLRNPYLNFLREFRVRNTGLSAVEIIRRGAKEWNNMPKEDKLHYIEEAFHAPKKRKPPSIQIQPQPNQMCAMPYQSDRGIVCPRMPTACPKKRRRKAKCARRRKPKKRRCGKKRRPKRRVCKPRRKRCKI
ncbi:protamine [Ceratitis capitata]|uniref:Protamine n=1 Tax=Ceratitis capitata TaxID=7213 RepID=W8C2B1_CERCA|nr:protamine [Ceratitis capitata]